MAKVSKQDIPEIASFMADLWTFTKDWWKPEMGNQWLKDMWQAGWDIHEKYHKHPFVTCIMTAVCKYFTEEWKKTNGAV